MHRDDIFALWLSCLGGSLAAFGGRIAYMLFTVDAQPPEDPAQRHRWVRKRWWLLLSEIAALPLFASCWTLAALEWRIDAPLVVMGSMAFGGLGFAFLLDALERLTRRKLGLEEKTP